MTTQNVDYVEYRGEKAPEEMRGYLQVEHLPGWVIWYWAGTILAVPSDLIQGIVTTEEETV